MMTPEFDKNLLLPIWKGSFSYEETGLFRSDDDEIPTLYKPTEIIRVTSYAKDVCYEEGVDFERTRYGIKRTKSSRIPVLSEDILYAPDLSDFFVTEENKKTRNTLFSQGVVYQKHQIRITYEHEPCRRTLNVGEHSDRFDSFIKKLERGENVTVFFLGDSISYGCNTSMLHNSPPYQPTWPLLVTMALAEKYGYGIRYADIDIAPSDPIHLPFESDTEADKLITYVNTSVGGWGISNAIDKIDMHLKDPARTFGCDLFVLGFGMNNRRTSITEFREAMRTIVSELFAISPNTSTVLLSPMFLNPFDVARSPGTRAFMEEAMYSLADELFFDENKPCAVAPMNSVDRFILGHKRFIDSTGNGINHPNDYLAAVYAQTILATLGII